MLSVSTPLSFLESDSVSSTGAAVLKAILLAFFSPFSCSLNQFISNSCSLSFPNNVVVLRVDRSFVFQMAVTFDCQDLSRHFSTLMFSSSLSKIFPSPTR